MEFKTTIDTRELGYPERDLEVMLVLLKILVVLNSSNKAFNFSRWNDFFNGVFPYEVKEETNSKGEVDRGVWAVSTAKKYLLDNGYIRFEKPKGKRYKLWYLENSNKEKIIEALKNNPRDFDTTLMEDIKTYIAEREGSKKSKFTSAEEAFKSAGL